jgi:hypothetical protein
MGETDGDTTGAADMATVTTIMPMLTGARRHQDATGTSAPIRLALPARDEPIKVRCEGGNPRTSGDLNDAK